MLNKSGLEERYLTNVTMSFRFGNMKNKINKMILFRFGAMLLKRNEIVYVETKHKLI